MDINFGLVAAGLAVGLLVGLTGMGAGSLMTPILINFFGIPAGTAVGTDLVYAAVTKVFGAARHRSLNNVNVEVAKWMGFGSVPAAFFGVFFLWNIFDGSVDDLLPKVIGYSLILVSVVIAIRTFMSIRGLWDHHKLPVDGEMTRNHKIIAVSIGVVFGFILGLTSVGSGVFFGMALITLFPLSARRVVGTDLLHAAMVTIAAGAATVLWGAPDYGYVGTILIGSIPGILIGSHFTGRISDRLLRGGIALVLGMSGVKLLSGPPVAYVAVAVVVLGLAGLYVARGNRAAVTTTAPAAPEAQTPAVTG